MSFILDALKKSESERQNRSGAAFSSIPASNPSARRRPWPWLIGALLAINLVVLLGILFRPGAGPLSPAAPQEPAAVPREATNAAPLTPAAANPAAPGPEEAEAEHSMPVRTETATFEQRIASARMNLQEPPEEAADGGTRPPESAGAAAAPQQPAVNPARSAGSTAGLRTIDELRLQGDLELPELRVDMHVYSEESSRRFVFINMSKYREQSRLDEGPFIREIRPDGVILEYDGHVFLLPRE